MNKTTMDKSTQSAATLAASLMIQELIKEADTVGNTPINPAIEYHVVRQYRDMLDVLATIVASTFSPAEA